MALYQAGSFKIGMELEILERGEVIDRVIVKRTGFDRVLGKEEIEVECLALRPGNRFTFAFFPEAEGWRMLFEDPFTDERCYSQRAPVYRIRQKG